MRTPTDEPEPSRQGSEAVVVRDVVDEREAVGPVYVVPGQADEVLVARHVPQVQSDEHAVHVEDTGVVVDPHRRRVLVAERPLGGRRRCALRRTSAVNSIETISKTRLDGSKNNQVSVLAVSERVE